MIRFSKLTYLIGFIVVAACGGGGKPSTDYLHSTEGVYKGIEETSNIISFKGIPYASPPIESLRFAPPKEPRSFSGLKIAKDFGAKCFQGNGLTAGLTTGFIGSEDCLTLNIFRPKEEGVYPILVWIHGGGLTVGSSSEIYYTKPYKLVETGIVVVSINYRLGLLGFLSTTGLAEEQAEDDGNYGIKDQQQALKWIQENAAAFGGDATNVTIFGESAGGHSVLTHLASPSSGELFSKAIVQSGAYSGEQIDKAGALELGSNVVSILGCDLSNAQTACLRAKSLEEIFQAQKKI
mgnify:FL=1